MNAQEQLWSPPATEGQCLYPMVSAASGYRYGCRCPRCSIGKARGLDPYCHEPECKNFRLKGRRYCEHHKPQGQQRTRSRREGTCSLCQSSYGWYESSLEATVRPELRDLYRQVCGGCRHRYIGAIKHHHLDTRWALRLITAERCEICDIPFPIDKHGRRACIIDHDHNCCPKSASCGQCLRGILCQGCNTRLGALENIARTDLSSLITYLSQHGCDLNF